MSALLRTVLPLSLALLVPALALATAAPAPTAQAPDRLMTALLDCHFGYAQQHFRSRASATEIATAAASYCDAALQAVAQDTYLRALAAGLPADSAEQSRQRMLADLQQMLPGFTLDKVIQFRAEADAAAPADPSR
ncbi:hypothetical protein [Stenotrophomonas sp.]|uniref:hypothetical protein n=1 Tax=Stenotrophomonas sp. TaxID=69392 RepID=UPI002FC7CAEA